MQTGQHHQQQMQGIHELLGHVAQGNQAIGQHMAMQNQIAQAPVEAIRDKMGKITGRRVVMPGA